MLMWIVLSSAFIAVFLLIRALFSSKIKATAMYALWILVAIRLLVPTYIPVELDLFENIKMPTITTQIAAVEQNTHPSFNNIVLPDQSGNNVIEDEVQVPVANDTTTDIVTPTVPSDSMTPNETDFSIHPMICIWLIGMIAFGCSFIVSNIKFYRMLLKKRQFLEQYQYKIPVYYVEGLQSPCMTGIINPGIYINERITDPEEDKYVLDHEFTHYKHKDNIWMLLQLICLCIHWYNPLVWISSALFRRDCECACDESLTKSLSDKDRVLYGKTLLQFAENKWTMNSIISTSTSMSMEGKTMKKRIHIIINHPPKKLISSLVAVILIIVLFAGAFIVNSNSDAGGTNVADNSNVVADDTNVSASGVTYELSLRGMGRNETIISSNEISIVPGDLVLSLSEEISDDVANRRVEGNYLDGALQNAILDIDYPFEMTGLDGTTIVAFEYIMKDVKSGDKITVTITKELQERLGLSDDQIVINCMGYDSKIIGVWEKTTEAVAIGDVPAEYEPSEGETVTFETTDTFEFREDKTGTWTTTFDEQHSSLNGSIDFTYILEGDQLILTYDKSTTTIIFTVSFSGEQLLLDGRNVVFDLDRID